MRQGSVTLGGEGGVMWMLTQTHKTTFIVTRHQTLTKCFTTDKRVNKSLRLRIYTVK